MINTLINNFVKEEDGQDLVEYSLLLGFIAVTAITVLASVQTNIKALWTKVNTQLSKAATP